MFITFITFNLESQCDRNFLLLVVQNNSASTVTFTGYSFACLVCQIRPVPHSRMLIRGCRWKWANENIQVEMTPVKGSTTEPFNNPFSCSDFYFVLGQCSVWYRRWNRWRNISIYNYRPWSSVFCLDNLIEPTLSIRVPYQLWSMLL